MFDFIMEECKNCGEEHFLYKTDFKCNQCKKRICKTCGVSRNYLRDLGDLSLECGACYNETNVKIRKMPTSENGVIREYNIIKELNSVERGDCFSTPSNAIDSFKHLLLSHNFNGIIYLKTQQTYIESRKIKDLVPNKSERVQSAYFASGIPVVIEKQL